MTGGGPTGGTGSGEGNGRVVRRRLGGLRGRISYRVRRILELPARCGYREGRRPTTHGHRRDEEHPAVTASTPVRIEADQRKDLEKFNCMRCLLRRTRRNGRETRFQRPIIAPPTGVRRGVSWWSWKASLQNGIRCRECQLGIWPACPENTGFLGPLAGTNDAFAKSCPKSGIGSESSTHTECACYFW